MTCKLALLWRGNREARADATTENNRYHRIFEELAARGIHAEPAVYSEEAEDEVRTQLLGVDGVVVWVNPQADGRNRHRLYAIEEWLRSHGRTGQAASRTPWMSRRAPPAGQNGTAGARRT